jgi:phosphohistidine phosphatase
MDLYLLRHATAVNVGAPNAPRDADRYLNDDGLREAREAAQGIRKIEPRFDAILTSPYPRARQTAEIVAGALGQSDILEDCGALAPGAVFSEVAREINRRRSKGPVLIVGHNPDFEEIIADSLTGESAARVNLKKCGLALLRFERDMTPGKGELRALIPCKALQDMGA